MNLLLRASASLAAMAAVVSVAYAVQAQDQAPTPGSPPSAEQRAAWMHDRQEAHAKALHAILNLRPDQEAAFQAFQAAMTPQPGERHQPMERGSMETMTTPQRLDRMADRLARREAEFRRRADAIKAFYAVLSPDQQRAFDAMPMMMGGHRHGMGHEPGHGGMDHGPDAQG